LDGQAGEEFKDGLMTKTPTLRQFHRGCIAFRSHEKRDAIYKTGIFLVTHNWGSPAQMADGLGALLLASNQTFYRYGSFDFQRLEDTIAADQHRLAAFRSRDILDYVPSDDESIRLLFDRFLRALEVCEGPKKGARSPVIVAKALHGLAPRFFPLWDQRIANAYGCPFTQRPSKEYVLFMSKMKDFAKQLVSAGLVSDDGGRTLLKCIDEYNYAKYTKAWI
jgi:hypothetical protein